MSIIREELIDISNFRNGIIKLSEKWGKNFIAVGSGDNKIYLDDTEKAYLNFKAAGSSGSKSKIEITMFFNEATSKKIFDGRNIFTDTIYADSNTNGKVLYLRIASMSDTLEDVPLLIAQDKQGNWVAFISENMITENDTYDLGNIGIEVTDKNLYSAFKMPNIENGSAFDELLKMFTARSYSVSNLYVTFFDKPYRVITMYGYKGDNVSNNVPCYAFEAQQEQEV